MCFRLGRYLFQLSPTLTAPSERASDARRPTAADFNVSDPLRSSIQCHYCDREVEIAVEKDGVKVGVCKSHFREQMEEIADSDWLDGIEDELDIDRAERRAPPFAVPPSVTRHLAFHPTALHPSAARRPLPPARPPSDAVRPLSPDCSHPVAPAPSVGGSRGRSDAPDRLGRSRNT